MYGNGDGDGSNLCGDGWGTGDGDRVQQGRLRMDYKCAGTDGDKLSSPRRVLWCCMPPVL